MNIFAHAGHSHAAEATAETTTALQTTLDHCTPVIIGAALIVLVLLGVITYLVTNWEPKKKKTTKKK